MLQVEPLLHNLRDPAYRQLNIEALLVLSDLLEANSKLQVDELNLRDLIHDAVRLLWEEMHPDQADIKDREGEAWENFYNSPPHRVANAIMVALAFLLEEAAIRG